MSRVSSLISLYSDQYDILPLHVAMPYFLVLILIELVAHWHHWCKYYPIFSPNAWDRRKREPKEQEDSTKSHPPHKYHQKYRPLYRINDAIASLCCGICEQLFGKLCLQTYTLMMYVYVYHYYRLLDLEDVTFTHHPGQFILMHAVAFIMKDWAYYWYHRAIHEINLGWSLHAPHHNSEEYNLTTALRQGMFQSLVAPIFYAPMALVGIPPAVYSFHSTLNLLWQFWIHTRMIKKFPRWFEFIFNTPSHHRVHHGRNPEVIDKNYGGTLIIFDRLHRTFEEEKREVVFGTVHPIQSFNPLTSQFHHLRDIFWACYSRGFAPLDWFKICFYPPNYNIETGGEYPLPDVNETVSERYNPHLNWPDALFALAYLLYSTVLGVAFLVQSSCTVTERFSQWAFLFSGLISLGYIIDGCKHRVRTVESIRMLIGLVALFAEGRVLSHVFPLLGTVKSDLLWMVQCSVCLFVSWYVFVVYQGDAGCMHKSHMYAQKENRERKLEKEQLSGESDATR